MSVSMETAAAFPRKAAAVPGRAPSLGHVWCPPRSAMLPVLHFFPTGLVQTIKDHVTKPTAMARGRVAHLIEWKGWSAPQTGWEPSLTEECYADLADELKEARFAAGVWGSRRGGARSGWGGER